MSRQEAAQRAAAARWGKNRVVAEERTREVAPPSGSSEPIQASAAKSPTQAGASPVRPTKPAPEKFDPFQSKDERTESLQEKMQREFLEKAEGKKKK